MKLKHNPFLRYGIGVQNYFNLQEILIKLIAIICLMTVPQMIIFS